jgi:hypothetical protein
MNDLRELLHESVAHSPADTSSNDDLLSAGRRRVRRRRAKLIGIPAVAAIAAVGLGVTYWPDGTSGAEMAAAGVPVPEGSVTRLEDCPRCGWRARTIGCWRRTPMRTSTRPTASISTA